MTRSPDHPIPKLVYAAENMKQKHPSLRLFALLLLSSAASSLVFAQGRSATPHESARAGDPIVELLGKVADAAGPSGFEEPIRKVMVDAMKPYTAAIRFDGLGSIIATQGTQGPRVMVDAHMDELGGMVRRIAPNGLLTMQMLGGWLDQALVDQRWIIIGSKGPVQAITGIRDIHVMSQEERTRVFPRDMIFLDVGAKTADEVRNMGVEAGDPVVPDAPFTVLNGTDNYLGKAWDDRVGCAVIVETMRRLASAPHPNQVSYVITTQEELGVRGAHTASDVVKPEIGIALEAGVTGDIFSHPEESQVRLGAGPALFLYDFSELPNRKFAQFVKSTAAARKVPLQYDLVTGYGDDSAEIQKSNGGVPTVNLVVPVRYTHAHNGIMNRRDFDQMVELLVALLQQLDAQTVQQIRDFTPE
jgi:putative aminopeptidase FrvX